MLITAWLVSFENQIANTGYQHILGIILADR